jgi:UPF0176 protein
MMYKVAAFYRFVRIENIPALRAEMKEFCAARNVLGTILIAPEGVNGTIAGLPDDLDMAVQKLYALFGVEHGAPQCELKFSGANEAPFQRLKVREKKEIITMFRPDADPSVRTGIEVAPEDWNDIINDPDVVLLDTRNDYEVTIGTFRGAKDPDIRHFSQFPEFVEKHLDPKKQKKIAMFCTGGIRCEKASAYMLNEGFETVYHLKGGILKYLENIPKEQSQWDGACFVFDGRLALEHGLEQSEHTDNILKSREYRDTYGR